MAEKLFSEIINIDWYDGTVLAIAKGNDCAAWCICNLVYIDFELDIRIFQIIKVEQTWAEKIIKSMRLIGYNNLRRRIKYKLLNNKSDMFLFRSSDLDSESFELRKISSRYVKYYSNIEKVINQENRLQSKWKSFFE